MTSLVSTEQLCALIAEAPPAEKAVVHLAQNDLDLAAWVKSHAIEGEWKEWQHGSLFVLKRCPWNHEHVATARVGQLTDGGLFAGCFHNSCGGKGWSDFREVFDPGSSKQRRGDSQTKRLVGYVEESGAELWKTRWRQASISFPLGNGTANVPLDASEAEDYLRLSLWQKERIPATATVIRDVLATLRAKAIYEGETYEAPVRVAAVGEERWLDLGDDTGRAILIKSSGWEVRGDVPIRFFRSPGTRPLPLPMRGGSIDALRPFINVSDEREVKLLVTFLTWAIATNGPCPVLILIGEKGSAKSTLQKLLVEIVDPRTAAITGPPRNEQDLIIAAATQAFLALDNLTGLQRWLSNALCRISTGGAVSTRKLYTGRELEMFESRLPIILTGIGEPATQADLLDRSIGITLEPIFEDRRRTDKDFWDGFGTTHAEVLGALLDLIVGALKHLPSVPTTGLPRMADFARFGIAVERAAGWPAGSFMEAYAANRKSSHAVALSGDPVATAILRFMASRDMWDDTATKLMAALLEITSEAERGKWWPTTPNHFSKRLREAAPVIREYGVEVHQGDREGIDGTRVIRLWRIAGDRR